MLHYEWTAREWYFLKIYTGILEYAFYRFNLTRYGRGEKNFWIELESNTGPPALQATALTTEPGLNITNIAIFTKT